MTTLLKRVMPAAASRGLTLALMAMLSLCGSSCGAKVSADCPPYPSMITVSPQWLRRTAVATEIQVTGSNFQPSSYLAVNGQQRSTVIRSSTLLIVALEPGDVSVARTLTLVVVTPDPFPAVAGDPQAGQPSCGDHLSAEFNFEIVP